MRIAVCEDNASENAALCAYVEAYCKRRGYECEIVTFESGEALLAAFSPGAFDILFLDIFLPGISGMDAARKIRETDRDCLLIFITLSQSFTMEGFLVQATGYLVKPIDREQLNNTLHMCRQLFERNGRMIAIPLSSREQSISAAGLLYVEVFDKEVVFHMKKGNFTIRLPLDKVEAQLFGEPFLRCHRSYIVNMNHVADMRTEYLVMSNGDLVPMRKNGRKEVRIAIANFFAGMPREGI